MAADPHDPRADGASDARLPAWLDDASVLLAEPDPGPTPWLIENQIVDGALVAAVGRWKVTKSYALLDMCISIATGRPAFGTFEIPKPGPVVFVNEESGRTALRRRLDALCRGRAVDPDEFAGRLHVAANARLRLDDAHSQNELVDIGKEIRPRLFVFDPLVRMKAAERKENEQSDMAALLDFMRHLREETSATVGFVHHQGHAGEHMRGTSDLESVWEARLVWKRDGQSSLVTIESEHREAESAPPFAYRIAWDAETQTMRFEPAIESTGDAIMAWIATHDSTTDEVAKGVQRRRSDVKAALDRASEAGTARRVPSHRTDGTGRTTTVQIWKPWNQAVLPLSTDRPNARTARDR